MTDCSSCDVSSVAFSIVEKKRDEAKTRKDATIQLRELVVSVFSSKIKGVIFSLPENCLVAHVKSKAGKQLHLNRISLEMFGLFVGPLECPTKHIPDEVTVGDHTEFSLQRILFWCGSEMLITRYDKNALDLLYCEMKYIFSGKDKPVENATPSEKIRYVDKVHKRQKYYQKYYYRIPNCTLSGPLVNEDCLIKSGASIQIALDLERLSILGTNREVVTCFKWQQVGAVMMEAKTKNLIKFRMGNKVVAVVDKDRGEYLFSLAIHIIKMNEEKFGTRSPHRIVPDHIHGYLVFFNDACYVSALKSSQETRGNIPEDLVMQSPLKLDEIKKRVEFYEEVWQDAEGEMELHEVANTIATIDDHIRDGDTQDDEDDDHRDTQNDEDVVGHVEEIEQDLQKQYGDSQDDKECVGHDHIVEDGRKTEEKDGGVQNIKDEDIQGNEKENVMPTT